MTDFQITCTRQEPPWVPHTAAHIVSVGSGWRRWTVAEAYRAMDAGDRFYTRGPLTGKTAWVYKHRCGCGRPTLRSAPDAVYDNNLDSLPDCP